MNTNTKLYAQEVYNLLYRSDDLVVQLCDNGIHHKRLKSNPQEVFTVPHNHRLVGITELVFDIDCHLNDLSKDIWQRISTNLQNDNIAHSVWWTSRSYHIHAFFGEFTSLTPETRKSLKLFMLKYYTSTDLPWCDKSLVSEKHTIRDFMTKHEVTHKPKTLIYKYPYDRCFVLNSIKPIVWEGFKNEVTIRKLCLDNIDLGLNSALDSTTQEKLHKFLKFACDTTITKNGLKKNNTYFKNIAIAVFVLRLDKAERDLVFKQVSIRCKHPSEKLKQWYKWCSKQNHNLHVNLKEVNHIYKPKVIEPMVVTNNQTKQEMGVGF